MALTATATPNVIRDVTNELSLQNCPLHIGTFDRPNIFYKVKYKDSLDNPLEELIKYVKGRHTSNKNESAKGGTNKNQAKECSGIIYVHKREDTYMIARAISKAGITASPYHAGLKKMDRATVQEGWSSGKIQVAVATVAFGMGIDRHCVRYVVHWSLPKTVEGFYQEAGRAGRDGLPSHSLLFYSPEDVGKYKYLIRNQGSKSKGRDSVEKRQAEKNMIRKLEQLEEMQDYCTQIKCRRNALIRHFGGKPVDCKKTCDVCKNPKKVERSLHSSTAIKDIRRQQNFFGKGGRKGKEKQPWNGQWDKPHGEDDENAIANDWGDNCLMVGDLRVTGPLGSDPVDVPRRTGGGFSKASDILSKYESMEGRYGDSSGGGYGDAPTRKQAKSITIPEHLKASLKAASDFTTANNILPRKKKSESRPMTSTDHAIKAKEIEEKLRKIKAEQEKRLKALQARTAAKPPPPPPAQLSFSRRKRK